MKKLFKKNWKTLLLAASVFAVVACGTGDEPIQYTAEHENELLNDYLDKLVSLDYDVDTTESGVYYVVLKEGEGDMVQFGDSIGISYEGYLMNGTLFDASALHYTDGIWKFVHGEMDLIPGFEEAIGYMNKGREVLFIIPSSKAYGSLGYITIPPYSTLRFYLKLQDIYPPEV